jgi:hypothetical protein
MSSATLADQPSASGTPAPTSAGINPATAACDVWQPLKKTHRTGLPRNTSATIRAGLADVGAAPLVLEREGAAAVRVHPAVSRQVDDVRPALGDQLGQLLEAAGLGEVQDHLVAQLRRRPQHRVFLALVVERDLVQRRGGQEQDPQRTRLQRAVGRREPLHRRAPQGPGGVAPDRQVRAQLHQLPGQVQHVAVGAPDQQLVRALAQTRRDARPGRLEPRREQHPADGPQRLRVGQGPDVPLEQVEEPPAEVRDTCAAAPATAIGGSTGRSSRDHRARQPGGGSRASMVSVSVDMGAVGPGARTRSVPVLRPCRPPIGTGTAARDNRFPGGP